MIKYIASNFGKMQINWSRVIFFFLTLAMTPWKKWSFGEDNVFLIVKILTQVKVWHTRSPFNTNPSISPITQCKDVLWNAEQNTHCLNVDAYPIIIPNSKTLKCATRHKLNVYPRYRVWQIINVTFFLFGVMEFFAKQ